MTRSELIRELKKSFFRAFIICVALAIFGARIYTTGQAAEMIGLNKVLAEPKLNCQASDYKVSIHKPTYAPPLSGVNELYESSLQGGNLVENANFVLTDNEKRIVNFEFNPSTDDTARTVETESNNQKYLKTTLKTDLPQSTGWVYRPIAINKAMYYYSFEYRSDTTAEVVLELQDANGKSTYKLLHNLKESSDWIDVEGHFENLSGQFSSARVSVALTQKGTLDYKNPKLHELKNRTFDKPMISISFDDGWEGIYSSAFPLLEQYDVNSTQFINPLVSQEKQVGYMNFKQIRDMANKGHEIGSHSLSHCPQTALNATDLEADAKQSEKIFTAEGFPPALGFAYPFGSYNPVTQKSVQDHYSYVRSSDIGFNDGYYDISRLKAYTIEATTPASEIKQWLDHAKANNLWLILVYHNIESNGSYSVLPGNIEQQLKAIKKSEIQTFTISEALEEIKK